MLISSEYAKNSKLILYSYIIKTFKTDKTTLYLRVHISKILKNKCLATQCELNDILSPLNREFDNYNLTSYDRIRLTILISLEDRLINEDNTNVFKKIINLCNPVLFFFSDPQSYYTDCMLNRVNKTAFREKWTTYAEQCKSLCELLENRGNYIVLSGESNEAYNVAIECLENDRVVDNLNQSIPVQTVSKKVYETARNRDNQFINQLIGDVKFRFTQWFRKLESKWAIVLEDSDEKAIEATIDEILDLHEGYKSWNKEQLTIYQNLISESKNMSRSICSFLIQNGVRMCDKLTAKTDEDIENRILKICDLLRLLAKHYIFRHRILNDENFIKLLVKMLECVNKRLNIQATKLINLMMLANHKRYGAALIAFDKKYFAASNKTTSCPKLLFDLIKTHAEQVTSYYTSKESDDKDLIELKWFTSNFEFNALCYVLKGSPENCRKLSSHDFDALIDILIEKTLSKIQQHIKFHLFEVLIMIVRYGLNEELAKLLWNRVMPILRELNAHLLYLTRVGQIDWAWTNLSNAHKELLDFVQFYIEFSSKKDQSSNKDDDENESEFIGDELKCEETSFTIDMELAASYASNIPDFIETFYESANSANQNLKPIRWFRFLQNKQQLTSVCCENESLKLKIESLERNLSESKTKEANYLSKITSLEADRDSRKDECTKLREQISLLKSSKQTEKCTNKIKSNGKNVQTANMNKHDDDEASGFINELRKKNICYSREEARKYIEAIADKRKNLCDFRELICGALKHLSADLYTSPMHFLSEIIQNFEDNQYASNESPFLKIILNAEFLIFCSNEVGFSPNDVYSICSLSESTKKKGEHIGHKGLGFKSVFLCTNNPIIVSNRGQWSFEFVKTKSNDEMAYITPEFSDLSQDRYSHFRKEIEANKACETFLCLPLKDEYKYSEKSKRYFDEILANVNRNVLLFTKKLKKIVIDDRINDKLHEITCDNLRVPSNTAIEVYNSNIAEKSSGKVEQIIRYKLFQTKVSIPEDLANEENIVSTSDAAREKSTEITLAFPDKQSVSNCPIFAVLPVCDLGFKFIINCYWSLITSREAINEHSKINSFLRDQIVELFSWVAANDDEIKQNIQFYIPKETPEMSNWWKILVNDIRKELKPVLNKILANEGEKQPRIYNEHLSELIEDECVLENCADLKLIYPNKTNLTELDLEYFGFKKLSILDLIECFSSELVTEWLNGRSKEWWQLFYRHMYNESKELENVDIRHSRLYRIRGQKEREPLLDSSKIKYYTCENKELLTWHDDIRIVDFESYWEEHIVKKIIGLPELNISDLIGIIIFKHIRLDLGSSEHVWQDLKFLKENFNEYEDFIRDENSIANNAICLPIDKKEKTAFLPASKAIIPTIFNYDLTKLAQENFIDFIRYKSRLNLLEEILEWEYFFLKLGCSFPSIDLDKLDALVNLNDSDLEVFVPFDSLNEVSCKLANKIFDSFIDLENSSLFVESLRHLPIKAEHKELVRIYPISSVYNRSMFNCGDKFNCLLPSVNVTEHALELAQKLGVSVNFDFESCLKVLKTLVEDEYKEIDLYIEWFLNLRTFISFKDKFDLKEIKLIYLSKTNADKDGDFFRLGDIYCCDESPSLLLICEYLNKTLVNYKCNSRFKPIETILIELGCKTKPTLEDTIACMSCMTFDKNLFNYKNPLSFLTSESYQSLKEMYLLLESLLKAQENIQINKEADKLELADRIKIGVEIREKFLDVDKQEIDLKASNFPLITSDAHLINYSSLTKEKIFVCLQIDLLNELKLKISKNVVYFDLEIAKQCPITMGYLNVDYLNEIVSVALTHENNNMEEVNNDLNLAIRRICGNDQLELLRVKYLSILMCIDKEKLDPSNISEEAKNSNRFIVFNQINVAMFAKKWLVVTKSFNSTANNEMSVIRNALYFALQTFHPDKSSDQLEIESADELGKLAHSIKDKSKWSTWSNASENASDFKLTDFQFLESDFVCKSSLSEVYFTSNMNENNQRTHQNQSQQRKRFTNPQFISDEDYYDTRIKEMSDLDETKRTESESNRQKEENHLRYKVNDEQQKRIGIKAEHFICRYLKHHYGESFNEFENWVSSASNSVYASSYKNFDDALGFDFQVDDYKWLFTSNAHKSDIRSKKCFVEVKGCAYEWDEKFHISKNELNKRDAINKDYESYVVVVVENVLNRELIRIAQVIDLTNQTHKINIEADSYLATVSKLTHIEPNNSNIEQKQQEQPLREWHRTNPYNGRNNTTTYNNRQRNYQNGRENNFSSNNNNGQRNYQNGRENSFSFYNQKRTN